MTKKLGDIGERIAERYLKEKGYKILDKNFRYSKLGELDIIAKKPARHCKQGVTGGDGNVIFIEVKARMKKRVSWFKPEDSITFSKQKKLVKLAQIYLAKKRIQGTAWQIDVLAIEIYRDGSSDIRHLENAVGDFY